MYKVGDRELGVNRSGCDDTSINDSGNTNIAQFIRLNNRLRANGFLSIPFLPGVSSPARSLLYGNYSDVRKAELDLGEEEDGISRGRAKDMEIGGGNRVRMMDGGVNTSSNNDFSYYGHISNGSSDDKYATVRMEERKGGRMDEMSQTLISSSNGLNIARTPEDMGLAKRGGERDNQSSVDEINGDMVDDMVLTPGINKYSNGILSEYSELNGNTDEYRTVGSILHNICNEGVLNSNKSELKAGGVDLSKMMESKVGISHSPLWRGEYYRDDNVGGGGAIELSFPVNNNSSLKLPPQAIPESQKLIVDGKKLISTINNLLYELESRGEHSVEALNMERSQKNGLIERLNLLKRRYEVLEKENESLRAINRSLSEDDHYFRFKSSERDRKSIIGKLEREKQQLLVENSRLKQDILKLQEDDDKSRDKADQFLKQIKNDIESEKEGFGGSNNSSWFNYNSGDGRMNGGGIVLTQSEKKKLIQSHYLYSIIVGFEKSILHWKNKSKLSSNNTNVDKFDKGEQNVVDKSIFSFCSEQNISSSELMKRDKLLWSRGLYLLQDADRTELESIIRWSCRLLNVSNFRNIPVMIGSLLSSSKKKSLHMFEGNSQADASRLSSTCANSSKKDGVVGMNGDILKQEDASSELHDRFYNHFKTLFDVLDDQDIIQVSNSVYIQLRDFKKLFKAVCGAFSLDHKTATISECIKVFNDFMSINLSSKKSIVQPQVQVVTSGPAKHQFSDHVSSSSSNSSAKHIIESLKIVLDVDSEDQILPTLKQHLESQSAIILSLTKSQQ